MTLELLHKLEPTTVVFFVYRGNRIFRGVLRSGQKEGRGPVDRFVQCPQAPVNNYFSVDPFISAAVAFPLPGNRDVEIKFSFLVYNLVVSLLPNEQYQDVSSTVKRDNPNSYRLFSSFFCGDMGPIVLRHHTPCRHKNRGQESGRVRISYS